MTKNEAIQEHYLIKCNIEESKKILSLIDKIYDEFEKDIEYKNLHIDKLIEQHKLQIINLFNSSCSNCIYVNKINNYTFVCNNKNSPLEDKITDKNFWCILGRIKNSCYGWTRKEN